VAAPLTRMEVSGTIPETPSWLALMVGVPFGYVVALAHALAEKYPLDSSR